MNYDIQAATVVTIRTTVSVTALVLFFSILFPVAIAQPAHAALLNDLSNATNSLATQVNAVTQSALPIYGAAPQSPSQASGKQTANTQAQPTPASVSTPATATAASQQQASPTTVKSARQPTSMTIEPRETLDVNNLRLMALMTPLALKGSQPSIVISGSSSTNSILPLHTSAQGWELFGVTWYWWATVAAAGVGGLILRRKVVWFSRQTLRG